MPRKQGGRGLISIEDCVKMEVSNLKSHLVESCEILLTGAKYVLYGDIESENIESGDEYKRRMFELRNQRLVDKKMHGKFFRDVSEVASVKSGSWITSGRVTKSGEGLLFAAQEQALPTNWLNAKITGESDDANCRRCKKMVETVSHLVSGCSELAQYEYRKRHDRMGLKVYWDLCKKYGIKCSEKWYEEIPDSVRVSKCGYYELWWDRPVETPAKLEHNRPDVIVIDRVLNHWNIIDFSVPNDKNVVSKEMEKVDHYNPLAYEIRKMNKVTTKIVPLVVGALGVVSNNLIKNLEYLQIPESFITMQVSAVLGTSIILRKVLNI